MTKQLEDILNRIEIKFHCQLDESDREEFKKIAEKIYTQFNDKFIKSLAKAKDDRRTKLKNWASNEYTAWRDQQLEEDLKYEFPQYGIETLIVERFLSGAVNMVESQSLSPENTDQTWNQIKSELNKTKKNKEKYYRKLKEIEELSMLVDKVAGSPRFVKSWVGSSEYSSDELKKQLDHISHMVTIISHLNFSNNSPNQLSDDPKKRYIEYVCKFYTEEFGIAAPEFLSDCFALIEDYYGYPRPEQVSQVREKCNQQLTRKKKSHRDAVKENTNELMASLGFSRDKK